METPANNIPVNHGGISGSVPNYGVQPIHDDSKLLANMQTTAGHTNYTMHQGTNALLFSSGVTGTAPGAHVQQPQDDVALRESMYKSSPDTALHPGTNSLLFGGYPPNQQAGPQPVGSSLVLGRDDANLLDTMQAARARPPVALGRVISPGTSALLFDPTVQAARRSGY